LIIWTCCGASSLAAVTMWMEFVPDPCTSVLPRVAAEDDREEG
jgi:hypothetical protein